MWGWEPEEIHIEDVDEAGRKIVRVIREPEYDAEQHAMVVGLHEYEASLDHNGLPLDEVFSRDADPENPDSTYHYEARSLRNWADDAIEQAEKRFADNPSKARRFYAVRVDHDH